MNGPQPNQPVVFAAPGPQPSEDSLQVLLQAPFADAWQSLPPSARAQALRTRLFSRVAAAQSSAASLHTQRRRLLPKDLSALGYKTQTLYQQPASRPARPGEPWCVRLLELPPGSHLQGLDWCAAPVLRHHHELLVLQGDVQSAGETLLLRDYQLLPAGVPAPALQSSAGALLFVREFVQDFNLDSSTAQPSWRRPPTDPLTVRDAEAGWPDFAPGIQRRVLWHYAGQAAMLYLAQPGAQVPQHQHGHDEECLMVQGELFLDDLLLQTGDYQLAPAGTGHRITETDTGVVIYAHGDLDLQFVG
jgi:hypothetical protein